MTDTDPIQSGTTAEDVAGETLPTRVLVSPARPRQTITGISDQYREREGAAHGCAAGALRCAGPLPDSRGTDQGSPHWSRPRPSGDIKHVSMEA